MNPIKITNKFNLPSAAALLVVLVILTVILRELSSFLQPFFFAIFIFYISLPIINSLKKKGVPGFISYLVPLVLVVLTFFIFGWIISVLVDSVAIQLPSYVKKLQGFVGGMLVDIKLRWPQLGEKLGDLKSIDLIPFAHLQKMLQALVGNFFQFISFTIMVIFFFIFLLQEGVSLPKRMKDAYGEAQSNKILEVAKNINRGIIRYVYVKGLASFLVAFLSTIAMLGFRLDLAFFWGLLTFFANFIPYLGSALSVILPAVIGFLQFGSFGAALALTLILVGCQLLVGNFLEPKYAGQELNLSPLVVLLSIAFWAWLWGIVGLMISIPLMVSIKIVLENLESTRKIAILMSHVSKQK